MVTGQPLPPYPPTTPHSQAVVNFPSKPHYDRLSRYTYPRKNKNVIQKYQKYTTGFKLLDGNTIQSPPRRLNVVNVMPTNFNNFSEEYFIRKLKTTAPADLDTMYIFQSPVENFGISMTFFVLPIIFLVFLSHNFGPYRIFFGVPIDFFVFLSLTAPFCHIFGTCIKKPGFALGVLLSTNPAFDIPPCFGAAFAHLTTRGGEGHVSPPPSPNRFF